jgi:hypothetical protein
MVKFLKGFCPHEVETLLFWLKKNANHISAFFLNVIWSCGYLEVWLFGKFEY